MAARSLLAESPRPILPMPKYLSPRTIRLIHSHALCRDLASILLLQLPLLLLHQTRSPSPSWTRQTRYACFLPLWLVSSNRFCRQVASLRAPDVTLEDDIPHPNPERQLRLDRRPLQQLGRPLHIGNAQTACNTQYAADSKVCLDSHTAARVHPPPLVLQSSCSLNFRGRQALCDELKTHLDELKYLTDDAIAEVSLMS